MFQLLGILLPVASFGLAIWYFRVKRPHPVPMAIMFTLMVSVGVVLFFEERISEIDIPHLGKIKAAAAQVAVDAKQVAEIRKRIEAQGATIDLVARSAADSEKRSTTLAEQVGSDARQVGEIKSRVEEQSSSIKVVTEQAVTAEARSREVATRSDEKAKKIREAATLLVSLRNDVEAAKSAATDLISKNDDATKRMAVIDASLEHASSTINKLEATSNFISTAQAASAGDRIAYDQLERWANDPKYPLATRARDSWLSVMETFSSVIEYEYPPAWADGVVPQKLTLSDLVANYRNRPDDYYTRCSLVHYIESRVDIPIVDRMDFLISVLNEDKDMRVIQRAGQSFAHLADLRIKPAAIDHFRDWWKEHRPSYISQLSTVPPVTPAPATPPK